MEGIEYGGAEGNTNRLKHGQRSKRSPWTLAKLNRKPGTDATLRRVYEGRRRLNDLVLNHRGQRGDYEDCKINEACELELAKRDIAEYFIEHRDSFTPEQWLTFRLAIPKATADRNKCLEKLGLDKPKVTTIWDTLNEPLPLPSSAAPTTGNGSSVDSEGNASNATQRHST